MGAVMCWCLSSGSSTHYSPTPFFFFCVVVRDPQGVPTPLPSRALTSANISKRLRSSISLTKDSMKVHPGQSSPLGGMSPMSGLGTARSGGEADGDGDDAAGRGHGVSRPRSVASSNVSSTQYTRFHEVGRLLLNATSHIPNCCPLSNAFSGSTKYLLSQSRSIDVDSSYPVRRLGLQGPACALTESRDAYFIYFARFSSMTQCHARPQAMEKGNKRQEPMMRLLRLTMTAVCVLVIVLSSISWYQSNSVVDLSDSNTYTIRYMGHRMFSLQASFALGWCGLHPLGIGKHDSDIAS